MPKSWTIFFDDDAFSAPDLDDDGARDVAGTVYHEARHAEQGYKMARMLAAKGNSPEQISAKMQLHIDAATGAHANPLPKGVEFATAAQQFDSVYGPGKAQHEKAEREAVTTAELRAAKQAADDNPTAGQQGALPAAGGRVSRLSRPADRERRVRHRALLRGELGRGASLKSPAARVIRRSQARVGHAWSRARACH